MNSSLIYRILKQKTENPLIQLFRYAFVGGLSFIVDFGFLWIFTEFAGLHYQISACISFILGLITNYSISTRWVFNATEQNSKDNKQKLYEFLIYTIIGLIGLGFNAVILWYMTEIININYLISKIISTIIVFLWNFIARRILMQRTNQKSLSIDETIG